MNKPRDVGIRYTKSYVSNEESVTNSVKCLICAKNDHRVTPSERFSELKRKDLFVKCLYHGAKGNHVGMCNNQYSCKHVSHKSFRKVKQVMVCNEHKDDLRKKVF